LQNAATSTIMMKRHRPGAPREEESSSDEEEDAFTSLAREQPSNNKRTKGDLLPTQPTPTPTTSIRLSTTDAAASASFDASYPSAAKETDNPSESSNLPQLPVSITSSMKRHHGVLSNARKEKMDSMLQELATTLDSKRNQRESSTFVPNKKGSYVDAGEEESTTNIFIGNLPTHVTEEQLGMPLVVESFPFESSFLCVPWFSPCCRATRMLPSWDQRELVPAVW
jgi:hypothetical protein